MVIILPSYKPDLMVENRFTVTLIRKKEKVS